MTVAATLATLALSATIQFSEIEAPFGLEWGQTTTQVEAQSVTLSICKDYYNFTRCRVNTLPKNLSNTDYYLISFSKEFGLVEVLWLSEDIKQDLGGIKGRDYYEELKFKLAEKYGTPEVVEKVNPEATPEQFYHCLANTKCGFIGAQWERDGVIRLQLHPLNPNEGFLQLGYRSPNFVKAQQKMEEQISKEDSQAL